MPDYGKIIGGGAAWAIILMPVGLWAMISVLPHALEILGAVCQGMRDFAAAVKG